MTGVCLPGWPMLGTFIRVGQQRFICVGFYTRTKAGQEPLELAQWEANCATCGAAFVQVASRSAGGTLSRRRCELHIAQGRKVTPA